MNDRHTRSHVQEADPRYLNETNGMTPVPMQRQRTAREELDRIINNLRCHADNLEALSRSLPVELRPDADAALACLVRNAQVPV